MRAWYLSPLPICAPASLEGDQTRINCAVLLVFRLFALSSLSRGRAVRSSRVGRGGFVVVPSSLLAFLF